MVSSVGVKMKRNPNRPIDIAYVSKMFSASDNSPSGLLWKVGPKAGKVAGCMVDRGYKIYWQISVKGSLFYTHRIQWAITNQKDPGNLGVKV